MSTTGTFSRRRFVASALSAAVLAGIQPKAGSESQPQLNTPKGTEMTTLTTYLLLDGTCAQAMEFYHSVFGGELRVTRVKESPAKDFMPASLHDRVVNAHLKSSNVEISASDWLRPNQTPIRGNTVCLFLSGGTLPELKALFEKLSEGANVTDPLSKQFFGFYGALNDQFGVRWMFQTNSENG